MVIISEQLPQIYVSHLQTLGFETYPLPADPRLPAPVSSHPDMLLFLSGRTLITDRIYYSDIAREKIDHICRQAKLSLPKAMDWYLLHTTVHRLPDSGRQ